MINEDQFELIESRYGCGYWNVCDDHACPCSPTSAVGQGYSENTYASMERQQKEYLEKLDEEPGLCVPGCEYLVHGKCQCIGFCVLDEDD